MTIVLNVRDANGIQKLQKQYEPLVGNSPIVMSGFLHGFYYFQVTSEDQQVSPTYKQ